MDPISSEYENIGKLNSFQLVQYMQDNLVIRATGGSFDNQFYIYLRQLLQKDQSIVKNLPSWITTYRTIDQFWIFIKGKSPNYEGRRKFIWDEFSPLLNSLEDKVKSPIEKEILFDESHINEQWKKSIERKEQDPEAAITAARTLIESILKHILDEQEIDYIDTAELPELYKEVAKSLNLAPEQHQEQIFKQILGGVSSIVSGLGALRNKLGDAHGKSKRSIKPSERHSELAVNLAGAVSVFLFKTFKENKS